jgi:predicted Zn finger-like uncharacterized protein
MRIDCPNCAAAYEVPASRITGHKLVRCARCGEKWVAVQESEDLPPPPHVSPTEQPEQSVQPIDFSPPLTAMDRLAASAPAPRRSVGLVAAWVATFVILIAMVTASVVWKEQVVRTWPPGARVLGASDRSMQAPGQVQASSAETSPRAKDWPQHSLRWRDPILPRSGRASVVHLDQRHFPRAYRPIHPGSGQIAVAATPNAHIIGAATAPRHSGG